MMVKVDKHMARNRVTVNKVLLLIHTGAQWSYREMIHGFIHLYICHINKYQIKSYVGFHVVSEELHKVLSGKNDEDNIQS